LKRQRVYGVIVSIMIMGLLLIFVGQTHLIYFAAAGFALLQMAGPIANVHSQSIWQGQVPPEMQGRVFSVRRLIAQFTLPVGTLLAGILGGMFDPGLVIMVMGALNVLLCGSQLFNRYLLRVEDKAYLDEMAARAVAGS